MKVGIIVGSIREGRKGSAVGSWVHEAAAKRQDGLDYELIELAEFEVPLLKTNTHPMAANKSYESEAVNVWSRAVDACDAYVFVTAEYNHGVPGAFKNAVDSLGSEWVGKPIAFAGYGSDGGVRAVEHWRGIVGNFQMVDVRAQVALSIFDDFDGDTFTPQERRAEELETLLDQLATMTKKLQA